MRRAMGGGARRGGWRRRRGRGRPERHSNPCNHALSLGLVSFFLACTGAALSGSAQQEEAHIRPHYLAAGRWLLGAGGACMVVCFCLVVYYFTWWRHRTPNRTRAFSSVCLPQCDPATNVQMSGLTTEPSPRAWVTHPSAPAYPRLAACMHTGTGQTTQAYPQQAPIVATHDGSMGHLPNTHLNQIMPVSQPCPPGLTPYEHVTLASFPDAAVHPQYYPAPPAHDPSYPPPFPTYPDSPPPPYTAEEVPSGSVAVWEGTVCDRAEPVHAIEEEITGIGKMTEANP